MGYSQLIILWLLLFSCSVVSSPLRPMDCSMPGFPVLHHLSKLAQTHVHWVGDTINHLILCHLFLLLPSIFPSIKVFSNELALPIRWPKYWSFSISPSDEYSGLISFRIYCFDLLESKGLSRVFSETLVMIVSGKQQRDLVIHIHVSGEGNGKPLQYSCLENPMDGGTW